MKASRSLQITGSAKDIRMRVSNRKLNTSLRRKALKILLAEVRILKTAADLDKFLGGILTIDERGIVLRRIIVADMLEGHIKYRDIQKYLDISHPTISKVRDILEKRGYGRNPHRKRIYSRTSRKKWQNKPLLGHYKGAASII